MSYMAYHEQKQEQQRKPLNNKEFARQMRTKAVADAGVVRVSTELWETIADIIENSLPIDELAKKICESYKYCTEDCPVFKYCRHERKGTLVWLKKVLNGDLGR